jgi:hypothetical protein
MADVVMRGSTPACAACVAANMLLGCASLTGLDEYRIGDASSPNSGPLACASAAELRNAQGECEAAGVVNCPSGFGPDDAGGCDYHLSCGEGLAAVDELQLPSRCYRFGCGEGSITFGAWVVDSSGASAGPGTGTSDDPFVTIQRAVHSTVWPA